MKNLLLILPLLLSSCLNPVAREINKMKAPAVIIIHRESDTYKPHVIVKDGDGVYWEIYDDIFENSKVGDTIKF